MNRRARTVLAAGIAAWLALPEGTRAAGNPVLQGQTAGGAAAAASQTGSHRVLVEFDGMLVWDGNVQALVNHPVIEWGPVLDDLNHTVDGEVWVVVERNDRAIAYHLSEQPASGATSYSGYTVVTKTIHTQRLLNFGQGEDVALIGNDRDAFLIATSEILVNSSFIESGYTVQSLSGTPPPPSLLHVGWLEHAASIPASTSATRRVASRWLTPDGIVIDEHQFQSSASGTINCASFGAGIGAGADNAIDVAVAAFLAAAIADGWFAVGAAYGQGGFPQMQPGESVAVGYALWLRGKAGQSFRQIGGSIKGLVTPFVAGVAASACERVNLGIDALEGLAEIEIPSIETTCRMQSVCTQTGSQVVGSTSSNGTTQGPDGRLIESVEIVGVTQQVCTDSEVVVVCGPA